MSGWGGGYVTDVEYIQGYYLMQSPHFHAVACLVNGVAVDPPWRNRQLHYLELGCGRGVNAAVLAASNPGWRVTALDFNPGAIAEARRFAAAAGIDNITFIEADLADFAETAEGMALPEADMVSMHGVWSWVGDTVREGILRLLHAKLRAGGLLHISYIGLPAMQGALGMQRLMREAGRKLAGRSDRQALAGRDILVALQSAKARQLADSTLVSELVAHMETAPVAYLAHEYMNDAWRPFFHADVAAALGRAKLDYAGSARLHENFPDLMLTADQRAVYDRFDDPLLRELVMDVCTQRTLRHDVFVRGTVRLSNAARDAVLGEVTIAMAQRPDEFQYEIEVPAGKAGLEEAFYRPVVQALNERPHTVAELLALPDVQERHGNPGETIAMLAGTYRAMFAPHVEAGVDARIRRFNAATARRDVSVDRLNAPSAMASTRLGAGYPCRVVELFLVERIGAAGGLLDPAALAMDLAPGLAPEQNAELAAVLGKVLHDRLDGWRNLGLV